MLLPIPSSPPGVVVRDDTTSASVKYPVFASVVNGQVVYEGVSSTKLYFTPSTGVLNATSFSGAGTGLTGTASGLSIGGNAATATLAASATNLAGGLASQLPVQTASGVTSFIGAPSVSGSFLQWTTGGGFGWTLFNGVTSFSAGSTGFTPSVATTGAVTLAGTLNTASGGTGASGLVGYVYANNSSPMTASTTIPNTAITGLGTMSTQNANAVAITGGTINGTTIGATVAAAGTFTIAGITQYATFTPTTAPTWQEGLLYYDSTAHTLNYYNDNNQMSLNIGQEQIVRVRNQTGSTLTNGQVVYVSGATGQTPLVSLAKANAYNTSQVIGVLTTDIANNGFGYVTVNGIVHGVDTSAFTDGQQVYLSPTVAGALTGTEGSAPNYGVHVGIVLYSHAVQGNLYVAPINKSIDSGYIIGQVAIAQGGTNGTAFPTAGAIAYGTGTAYGFTAAGTVGQVLTSANSGTPTWTSQSALSVGSATTATSAGKSTNLAGGLIGYLPYQSAADTTTFLAPGTNGQVLTLAGGVPTWAAAGAGTVTSVGLSLPSIFTVTGSPVTTTGTLTGTLASQTANTFFAAPNGASGTPTFRAMVAADVPTLNQNTTGSAATVTTTINSGVVATTQAIFDNSTKVATTAFTQRALGAWSGLVSIGANATIDSTYANKVLRVDATATLNFTPSGFAVGTRFMVIGNGFTGTLTTSTGSFISYGAATLSSISVTSGNGVSLFWDGGNLIMENTSLNIQSQTWTDVTASRALATSYTNTTGKPLFVAVSLYSGATNGNKKINFYVNGAYVLVNGFYTTTGNNYPSGMIVVPVGATYSVDSAGSNVAIGLDIWRELR